MPDPPNFPTSSVSPHPSNPSLTSHRSRTRSEHIRKLYRDLVPNSFERCLTFDDLRRWQPDIHGNILDASCRLAQLVAVKLNQGTYFTTHGPSWEENEVDMCHLLNALSWALDKDSEYHKKHRWERLPKQFNRTDRTFTTPIALTQQEARDLMDAESNKERAGTYGNTKFQSYFGRKDDDGVIHVSDDDDAPAVPVRFPNEDSPGNPFDPVNTDSQGYDDPNSPIDQTPRDVEIDAWLDQIANTFGVHEGWDGISGLLGDPRPVSLQLLESAARPAKLCARTMRRELRVQFAEDSQRCLDHMSRIVTTGDPQLVGANSGERDDRFMYLSKLLRSLEEILAHALNVDGGAPARDEAARRVSEVNQAMIEAMLKVPTFNMQLEALREIKRSLAEAARTRDRRGSGAQLKGIVAWMDAKRVLPHILRPTYLHHKQYVDQVAAVLRFLLEEDAMTEAHIDELWAITQKQDTFEEVKNNVLDLLASLAWKFSDEQLDYLFTLFEGAGHDALADCGKILETVQKLAGSDGKGVMADRLLELLWRMTHDAGGAEMVAAFVRVLGHYDRMERASKSQWMARVIGDIHERRADLGVSLRLVVKIVQLDTVEAAEDTLGSDGDADGVKGKKARRRRMEERRQVMISPDDQDYEEIRRAWIEKLNAEENLLELLTTRFEEFQAHAWSLGFERARPADAVGQPGAHRTGYQDTLKAFMETLLYAMKTGHVVVETETALRFWSAFVEAPGSATAEALDPGVKPSRFGDYGRYWMMKMLVIRPCSASPETVRTILETRLANEPANEMRKEGYNLFMSYFLQCAADEGKLDDPLNVVDDDVFGDLPAGVDPSDLGPEATGTQSRLLVKGRAIHDLRITDSNFVGLDLLWRVFLDAPSDSSDEDDEAWEEAAHHLMWLHLGADAESWRGTVAVRNEFLAAVIERLKESAAGLDGEHRAVAEQRAERLTLIASTFISKCEGAHAAAPGAPLPHGGSYPGFGVKMEVIMMHMQQNVHGGDRRSAAQHEKFIVDVHSNVPVRLLREAIAREVSESEPNNLRLLCFGQELKHDHKLLREVLPAAAAAEEDQSFTVQCIAGLRKTDDVPSPRENSPRALLASQPGAYDVLLELVDRSRSARVRENAQEILQLLPTRESIRRELVGLLEASTADPAVHRGKLRDLLGKGPAELVYALQVLDGLLSSQTGFEPGTERTAGSVATLRSSFLALGCARDILTTLPSGITGEGDETGAAAESAAKLASAGLAAWRDVSLRRALCTAALSLLRILLRGPRASESEPSESLGSLGGAIGTMGLKEEKDPPSLVVSPHGNDDDATGSRKKLAEEAITALANLAYIMGTGIRVGDPESSPGDAGASAMESDAGLSDDSVYDEEDELNRDDWRLSRDSLALLALCTQLCASGESHPADAVMCLGVFPRMLRDMLIQSRHAAIRMNTANALYQLAVRGGHGDRKDGGDDSEKEVSPTMVSALLSVRPLAIEHPSQCEQYHLLLCRMLSFHDDMSAIEELLKEEVEALQVTPPATEETEAMLRSRLLLIRTLIERLERVGRGSKAAGRGLVQVLLFRCLFPEAVPMLRPSAETLKLAGMPPPIVHGGDERPKDGAPNGGPNSTAAAARGAKRKTQDDEELPDLNDETLPDLNDGLGSDDDADTLSADVPNDAADPKEKESATDALGFFNGEEVEMLDEHLSPVCASSGTRAAAFRLLAELCAHDTENMVEVCDVLMELHYRGGVDVNEWNTLPSHNNRLPGGYVGLKNAGATCYMNSVFQQLYMVPELRNAVLSVDSTAQDEEERKDSVFYQFQMMFASLAATRVDFYAPRGFWRAFKDYDGEPINVREHQDGLEFFSRLQDMVDTEFKKSLAAADPDGPNKDADKPNSGVKGAMEAVMGGQFVNQMLCRECPAHRSERLEDFVHVSVDVRNKRDLVESLASYVQGELLESDNQWFCEQCGKKVDAVKRACFSGEKLPNTLLVHLKRFEFDYETMQRLKIKSRFEFPMDLDMSPFTVEGIERDAAVESDPSAPLPDLPLGPDHYKYRLVGVVVHSGTAFAGHYYSYIRERGAPPGANALESGVGSRWHVYDDQRVDPYDVSNLEADAFGGKYSVNMSQFGGGSDDGPNDVHGPANHHHVPRTQSNRLTEHDRPNSAYMLFYERVTTDDAAMNSMPPSRAATPGLLGRSAASTGDLNDLQVTVPVRTQITPVPDMPRQIRGHVMTQNLQFVFNGNLFSREYFAFMQRLMDSTPGGAGGPARKSQRRGERGGPRAAVNQKSDVDSMEDGAGGGRRTRTPEEEDEHAVLSVRIATEFLTHVYLRAHGSMRDERGLAQWRRVVAGILERSPASCRWFLAWIRARPQCLHAFLQRCPSLDARDTFASIVSSALVSATRHDDGGASAEALLSDPENKDRAAGPLVRGASETSKAVDRVLGHLARHVTELLRARDTFASPVHYFKVLNEYCKLGPGQALQLLRFEILDLVKEFIHVVYTMPNRAGLTSAAPELKPSFELFSWLLCACDCEQLRTDFAVVAVEEAKKTYRTLERVGDVLEDSDEANGVEKTAPPSPFALPDTNGGFKGWVTYSHPTTGDDGSTNHIGYLLTRSTQWWGLMVDLACDDDAMRRALLHVCWRWEWPSYVATREIQSQIEDEDHMDHMHGYLRLMESLMALDDWAQERRVRLCLEGPTEVQFPDGEKKDAPHLQAAYDAITGKTGGKRSGPMAASGAIELTALRQTKYSARYVVCKWLVRTASRDTTYREYTLECLRRQKKDWLLGLECLEDDRHRYGAPQLSVVGMERSDSTPSSAAQHPGDEVDYVVNRGRELVGE